MRQAQDEVARVTLAVQASGPLMIPVAPVQVRPHIGTLEAVLDTLYRIDYVLESAMSGAQPQPDPEYVRGLTRAVQERAQGLSMDLADLPSRFDDQADAEASASYANAAGAAYQALLQRIEDAAWQMMGRAQDCDAEIVESVSEMVGDPRIQGLRQ